MKIVVLLLVIAEITLWLSSLACFACTGCQIVKTVGSRQSLSMQSFFEGDTSHRNAAVVWLIRAIVLLIMGVILHFVLCLVLVLFAMSRVAGAKTYAFGETFNAPAEVHVKAVEREVQPVEQEAGIVASRAVAIVCGNDEATADRYEARNDALRSIARQRDLSSDDVNALMAYLRSQDDSMRVERDAALKNDVMNFLRNQDPPPKELVETLIGMLDGNNIGKNNFNSSGATAPDIENAAKFRGENKKVVFTSCFSCFQFYTFLHDLHGSTLT